MNGRRYVNRGTHNYASPDQSGDFDEYPDIMGRHPYIMEVYGRGMMTYTNVGIIEFFYPGGCCCRGRRE